jgi:hypothetical protein
MLGDVDGDGTRDMVDNCVTVRNVSQANTDATYDLPPSIAYDDATRPMSDAAGDACDFDDDNDGLRDGAELSGAPCASASAPTNPHAIDTDGDLTTDGAECALGTDPVNSSVEPATNLCGANADSDGDLVVDYREVCSFGTSPLVADSDGDGCSDGKEVGSVNGDKIVNATDLSQVAQHFGNGSSPAYLPDFDLTKDGAITAADLGRVATVFGSC